VALVCRSLGVRIPSEDGICANRPKRPRAVGAVHLKMHANAEHRRWRTLQRYLGRREYFDETYAAIVGLVSDRA